MSCASSALSVLEFGGRRRSSVSNLLPHLSPDSRHGSCIVLINYSVLLPVPVPAGVLSSGLRFSEPLAPSDTSDCNTTRHIIRF